MSRQDVTRSSLCPSVKECWTKRVHNFLFQNPKNYSLRDVQRFCYHSWCDLMVIFDQISNSGNVNLSLSWFWTATCLIIIYHLPSILKSRIPPKIVWSVQSLIPIRLFAAILVFLSQIDWLWNKILWQLCSFSPSMTYKENSLYATHYNSYAVEDKQTKLSVWTDVGWWYLVCWPIDRCSSVT